MRSAAALKQRDGAAASPFTFFEVATAVGFLHFVRRRVEAAVLEVGLGGRLDSTNVCRPVVSRHHQHQLRSHEPCWAIAWPASRREKAGIVKPGRPVVSGATVPEARAVIERICRERRAPLRQLGVDFRLHLRSGPRDGDADAALAGERSHRSPSLAGV